MHGHSQGMHDAFINHGRDALVHCLNDIYHRACLLKKRPCGCILDTRGNCHIFRSLNAYSILTRLSNQLLMVLLTLQWIQLLEQSGSFFSLR